VIDGGGWGALIGAALVITVLVIAALYNDSGPDKPSAA
jgi:hypothetical protein